MSFLSKNWAGLLVCLIISIISWVLGGFLPVVGAPVFAIFIGMILYPFLTPYKQLDAGLTYSSKKIASVCCYLAWVWTQYLTSLRSWKIFPSCHSIYHFYSLDCCLSLPALFWPRYKASYLDRCRFLYLWRFCHCSDCSCYSRQGKRSSPSHFCYLFLQCLGSSYLSNSRFLAPSFQRGFALFAGTAVNDTSSVTATASSWDSLYHTNTLESATIVKLTRTLAIIPITLFLSYWQSRQQDKNQGVKLKKIFPVFILYFILASLLTTLLTSFRCQQ